MLHIKLEVARNEMRLGPRRQLGDPARARVVDSLALREVTPIHHDLICGGVELGGARASRVIIVNGVLVPFKFAELDHRVVEISALVITEVHKREWGRVQLCL